MLALAPCDECAPGREMIPSLKRRLRDAIIHYRSLGDHLDCGANLAAQINPDVAKAARRVNDLAQQLRAVDPDFPASWTPYPTGE